MKKREENQESKNESKELVTKGYLSRALKDYPTKEYLNKVLLNYPTKEYLDSALGIHREHVDYKFQLVMESVQMTNEILERSILEFRGILGNHEHRIVSLDAK